MSNHGLTADNMMQQFPIALQKDPKTVALGQAIAKVMACPSTFCKRVSLSLDKNIPGAGR